MCGVGLIVDTASATRRLGPDEFARWAATRTVFLSSEMRELGPLRETVADRLRAAGFSVVLFEDLGGRDEDAERAYLDGVARSEYVRRDPRRPLRDDASQRTLSDRRGVSRRATSREADLVLAARRRVEPPGQCHRFRSRGPGVPHDRSVPGRGRSREPAVAAARRDRCR